MKFYQTVTKCEKNYDEWLQYEGYDVKLALEVKENESRYVGNGYITEVREYDIPDGKLMEDLTPDEVCAVLSSWNVVEVGAGEQ